MAVKSFDPVSCAAAQVLLVAPHQDDEALGCGGTVHLMARAGAAVHVVIAASGEGGIVGGASMEEREEESRRCCRVLGTAPPQFLRVPSAELKADPWLAGRRLAALMDGPPDARRFDLILVPSPLERHDTHRATLLAALCAGVAAPGTRWLGYGVWDAVPAWQATLEVDITAARSAKTQAIAAHRSQNSGRALAAAMAARDMEQAVFARITGAEERRAVERLMELPALSGPPPRDVGEARGRVVAGLADALGEWAAALWPRA
jgi:LmbE family N-acetylglucosaminyl deacetylase